MGAQFIACSRRGFDYAQRIAFDIPDKEIQLSEGNSEGGNRHWLAIGNRTADR